ncbi:14331_t:CDS:2 [Entrophospora sp. SA101]|nr:2640_t:CDS:2 [Entrophospora sp. SA101]CAJ0838211.1 14331_t:CDS:2 [Entrophospora sp. SA101]
MGQISYSMGTMIIPQLRHHILHLVHGSSANPGHPSKSSFTVLPNK